MEKCWEVSHIIPVDHQFSINFYNERKSNKNGGKFQIQSFGGITV